MKHILTFTFFNQNNKEEIYTSSTFIEKKASHIFQKKDIEFACSLHANFSIYVVYNVCPS